MPFAISGKTTYKTRDLGSGVEEGEIYARPMAGPDWTGKRPYCDTDGPYMIEEGRIVYLFDDEVMPESPHFAVEVLVFIDAPDDESASKTVWQLCSHNVPNWSEAGVTGFDMLDENATRVEA